MSNMKRCVQCGVLKEADAFRPYTYSRDKEIPGRYRICRSCEAINMAYTRAKAIVANPSEQQVTHDTVEKSRELVEKTERLYGVLEAHGLRVPTQQRVEESSVDKLLTFYSAIVLNTGTQHTAECVDKEVTETLPIEVPDELNQWLNVDPQTWLDNNVSPEFLQETIYGSLKAKYRPQIGVDHLTFLPIYDDTYKTILNTILRRFDDYEETCSRAE